MIIGFSLTEHPLKHTATKPKKMLQQFSFVLLCLFCSFLFFKLFLVYLHTCVNVFPVYCSYLCLFKLTDDLRYFDYFEGLTAVSIGSFSLGRLKQFYFSKRFSLEIDLINLTHYKVQF